MPTPTYPETRYIPTRLINLASKDERARLSASALDGFFRLSKRWNLRDDDTKQLLRGVSNGPYYQMKRLPGNRVLDPDTLLRISYLLGIFKALSSLHGQPLADQWISLPNSNRIFGGGTPLGYMIQGGLPGMSTVRCLLDARQVGL